MFVRKTVRTHYLVECQRCGHREVFVANLERTGGFPCMACNPYCRERGPMSARYARVFVPQVTAPAPEKA